MNKVAEQVKRLRVRSCFAYHEEKVSDTEIAFGWVPLDTANLEMPFIVSYGSKSKSVSKDDAEWSKQAGVNAASLSDYLRYFNSLTGDSPEEFISKWGDDEDKLEEVRSSSNPQYREGEGAFLLSLASLLLGGSKFSKYGRIFKLINE